MRQIFHMPTEPIFERACSIRDFGDPGNMSWQAWYNYNAERTRMTSGELEQAVAESLGIPSPARNGYVAQYVSDDEVALVDLEESSVCDMNDPSDKHLHLAVEQFREWLVRWQSDWLERVMGTHEASELWGLSQVHVKKLCLAGKLKARLVGKHWILVCNQPNPRQK